MEEIRCPKCGSDNVQSVKMIYMQGTTDKASVSITNLGEYVTSTEGGSQTLLAQAIAAPKRKKIVGILEATLGAVGIPVSLLIPIVFACIILDFRFANNPIFIFTLFFIFFSLMVWWILKSNYENGKWNEEVYPKLYKEWESQFVCHKCGKIFTPK